MKKTVAKVRLAVHVSLVTLVMLFLLQIW